MFETALVESSHLLRTRNRAPALLSVAAQAVLIAAIVAYPLLRPDTLIPQRYVLLTPRIPMPAPPIPPPPQRIHLNPTMQPIAAVSVPTPQPILHPNPSPEPPSTSGFHFEGPGMNTAVPAIFGDGTSSHPSIAVFSGTNSNASAAATHTGTSNAQPNISTGVSAGLLLTPIQPIYPAIARAAHQQGTVLVEATISTTGRIQSAHATSGPATLQASAVDAVRSARYRPFLLNGQPTEVTATFSIHFQLNE